MRLVKYTYYVTRITKGASAHKFDWCMFYTRVGTLGIYSTSPNWDSVIIFHNKYLTG